MPYYPSHTAFRASSFDHSTSVPYSSPSFLQETPLFESAFGSPPSPPDFLLPLLQRPDYKELWDSLDAPSRQLFSQQSAFPQHPAAFSPGKRLSRRAQLLLATASEGFVAWMELERWEQDHGNFYNAHAVFEAAARLYPTNELLLQKRLKLEERVAHGDHVRELLFQLIAMNSSKSVKVLVEGITSLAKLGYELTAKALFQEVARSSRFYTGNLVMEMLLYEYRVGDHEQLLALIARALREFPKHGPIWFFVFDFYEHDTLMMWNYAEPSLLSPNPNLDRLLSEAEKCLPNDILWKILSNRNQYYFRCTVYIQVAVSLSGIPIQVVLQSYHVLTRYLAEDMRKAIQKCPDTLVWKLYLQFGRFTAVVGFRELARQVGVPAGIDRSICDEAMSARRRSRSIAFF